MNLFREPNSAALNAADEFLIQRGIITREELDRADEAVGRAITVIFLALVVVGLGFIALAAVAGHNHWLG